MFDTLAGNLTVITSKPVANFLEGLGRTRFMQAFLDGLWRRELKKLRGLDSILYVSDVNIGDCINSQVCLEGLRKNFPDCRIDYLYNRTARPIVKNNPYMTEGHPVFENGIFPQEDDKQRIEAVLRKNRYDFIINTTSFLNKRSFRTARCPVIPNTRLIGKIVASHGTDEISHNTYWQHRLIIELAEYLRNKSGMEAEATAYPGVKCYLSEDVFAKRAAFLRKSRLSPKETIVFYNPDTSNDYTFISLKLQVDLLKRLVAMEQIDKLLLGHGFTFKGVERQLLAHVPRELRPKVVVMPRGMPIDVYASIVDLCELFITGDTGPMHIAAAKRVCVNPRKRFRNRTALVSIFGATATAIYGYDSSSPGHLPSNQKAPAKLIDMPPDCKSLACTIQRAARTCPQNRCFEKTDVDPIVRYVERYLYREGCPRTDEASSG